MRYVFLFMLIWTSSLYAVDYKVMLGKTPVVVRHLPGSGKTFIHLHHNEQTALQAARAVIAKQGGSLITLVHAGGRNVHFELHNRQFVFDPNRIFSPQGIQKTLMQLSQYTPEAQREVEKLADKIKALLPAGKVIAVHNNAAYSLKEYLPGRALSQDAQAVYRNPKQYYRNFYLVTQPKDYWRLKAKGFNGILQNPAARDDGSLSILLAKNAYVNVEAGFSQLKEQIRMLEHA